MPKTAMPKDSMPKNLLVVGAGAGFARATVAASGLTDGLCILLPVRRRDSSGSLRNSQARAS